MNALRRTFALVLPLLLALAPNLQGQALREAPVSVQVQPSDGPYVLWEGSEAKVFRVYDSSVAVEHRKGAFELPLPGLAARPLHLAPQPPEQAKAIFDKPEKIIAVSDVHGQFGILLHLLQAQKVVDEKLQWSFGRGHLVIAGDVMDRGSQVTEAYWFLRGLEAAALHAGGRVHVLLGNHESMVMTGDPRYLNAKYALASTDLPPISELYGPHSELGRWLRSRPTLLKLGDFLFLHGGISPGFLDRNLKLEQVNAAMHRALTSTSLAPESLEAFLLGPKGPLWYRGLVPVGKWTFSSEEDVNKILKAFHVQSLIVGHTTLNHVSVFHDGKVYGIDAGILDQLPGEAWIWEKGRVWRGLANGTRVTFDETP